MSSHNTGLTDDIIENIKNIILNNSKVEKIILYGSRAKGNFRSGSDIDICLKGKELTTNDILSIEDKLDDLNLPYTFDLSIFHLIDNSSLKDHISRVGINLSDL
ncbi:MAG: nucleotidyltransferase domain-containing protein [Halobacteriovoraceae bacterium]|nr:nucleotidyltransferase domain-containing protein [Halobacteriovoraceae bacterium]